MPRFDTVSFLSDYGLTDEFVGVCKAVIRRIAPHVTVLDICHELAPHDVRAGSLALARAAQYLPSGVVLGDVDLFELGESIDPLSLLPGILPLSRAEDGKLVGEVLWVDRFGNVQLNVDPEELDALGDAITMRFADQVRTAVRATTYDELGPGQIGLVIDSYGLVSVALARRSAADELRLQ